MYQYIVTGKLPDIYKQQLLDFGSFSLAVMTLLGELLGCHLKGILKKAHHFYHPKSTSLPEFVKEFLNEIVSKRKKSMFCSLSPDITLDANKRNQG